MKVILFFVVAIVVFVASMSSLGSDNMVGLIIAFIVVGWYIWYITKPPKRYR